jgi:hypothetical protein
VAPSRDERRPVSRAGMPGSLFGTFAGPADCEIGAGEPLVSAGSGGNTYEDED